MRRAILVCAAMFTLSLSAVHAQQKPAEPRVLDPVQTPKEPNLPPIGPSQQSQQQQQQGAPAGFPAPWYCNASAPVGGSPYPVITTTVQRNDTNLEYAGSVPTWTPIDNWTECHIRQVYVSIPDAFTIAPNGAYPDLFVELVHRGTFNLPKHNLTYDIVPLRLYTGYITFRIDAQSTENLYGDYDFYISVVGLPKTQPPPTPAKK